MTILHPARTIPFRDLVEALRSARDARLVSEQASPDGLRLYCYTPSCVYDGQWNDATLIARGLVLDVKNETVAATPFPKFFNVFEQGDTIPDLPFETFEKVDGSLIIIFWHAGEWKTTTKGAFRTTQAQWAAERLKSCDLSALRRGTTYLAEAVYAENRIVVRYAEDALVLLAAYDESGAELSYASLCETADRLGWRMAMRHGYDSVSQLMAEAKDLPVDAEGFVVRFNDGLRLKIKGAEYRRIHALISRITPLAMWELMQAGDDLAKVRKDIPEEFWTDFDAICALLTRRLDTVVETARREAASVAHLSDKDVGLRLDQFPADIRPLIFPYRKQSGDLMSGRARQMLFRLIRPTANELPGYVPSYAINRVLDESM
jgi:putative RNA ligase